jgi:hypothetical protein
MVTKIMKWVSITALLLVVSWRPSGSYQLPPDFVVCAGAVLVMLALFAIKQRIETQYGVYARNRSDLGKQVTVKP